MLDPDDGLRLLGRMLDEDAVQVTVAPVEWDVWAARLPGMGAPSLLRSLVAGGAVSAASSRGTDRSLLRRAAGSGRQEEVLAYVVARLAEVLDLDTDRLEPDRALDTLGLDSLMAVELRSRFRSDLDADVPLAALLSGERVDALAGRLATVLRGTTEDAPGDLSTAGQEETASQTLARFEELTDDEVDAMLARLDTDDGPDESPGGTR